MTQIQLSIADGTSTNLLATAHVDPSKISAVSSSLGFAVLLPLEIQIHGPYIILALSGTLAISDESSGISIPFQSWLFNQPMIEIPISSEHLARLERKRAGQELRFAITLIALVHIGMRSINAKNISPAYFEVPRDVWLHVLDRLDGKRRRIIELPAIPIASVAEWAHAEAALQRSSAGLLEGKAGVALSETRTAVERTVEALGTVVGRPRTLSDRNFTPYALAVEKLFRERHVRQSDDPYLIIAQTLKILLALFGFSSEPLHQGLNATSARDAEMALSMLTAIYSYGLQLPILVTDDSEDEKVN